MYNGAGLFIYSADQKYFKSSSLLGSLFDRKDDQKEEAQTLGEPLLYTSGK